MTTDTGSSDFLSMLPTFGWRRVVDLADEFKVSPADMVVISNRLGLVVADASEWLDEDSVDLIRSAIASRSAKGVPSGFEADAKARKKPKPVKVRAPKPPKPAREPKAPMALRARKERAPRKPRGPLVRKLVPMVVGLVLLAGATGVVVDRWIDQVVNTDAPATVVTTDGK